MFDQANSTAASPAPGAIPAPQATPARRGDGCVFPARQGVRFDPAADASAGAGAGGGTGGAAAAGAGGAGGGSSADQGDFVRVPRSEYDSMRQYETRFKGAQPFYERASKLGFKRPEDFDAWEPVIGKIKDPKVFGQMFSAEAEADLAGGQQAQQQQQQAFKPEDIDARVDARLKRALAEQNHAKAVEAEGELLKKLAAELVDEGAGEFEKSLAMSALKGHLEELREMYEEGHPLADTSLRPFDEKGIRKGVEHFKKLKAQAAGSQMNERAEQAARSASAGSPAGDGGGQGRPSKHTPGSKGAVRAAIEQTFDRAPKAGAAV